MEYSFGQAFFTLLSLIPTTFVLSSWIIARFIWLPWRKKLYLKLGASFMCLVSKLVKILDN